VAICAGRGDDDVVNIEVLRGEPTSGLNRTTTTAMTAYTAVLVTRCAWRKCRIKSWEERAILFWFPTFYSPSTILFRGLIHTLPSSSFISSVYLSRLQNPPWLWQPYPLLLQSPPPLYSSSPHQQLPEPNHSGCSAAGEWMCCTPYAAVATRSSSPY